MSYSKIDKGRALGIMGFKSSRPLDVCVGNTDKIRELLDKALFERTQEILHGKNSLEADPGAGENGAGRRKSMSRQGSRQGSRYIVHRVTRNGHFIQ